MRANMVCAQVNTSCMFGKKKHKNTHHGQMGHGAREKRANRLWPTSQRQFGCIMWSRDLVFSTWYLNKTRNRTWDHFLVVVKIEEMEMRVRKGKKGGWVGPQSKKMKRGNSNYCVCPEGSRSWCDASKVSGLEDLQARLEGAVVEVKATTLASRNKNKFMVPDEIRELASMAAQCCDPVKRRVLRKKAQKARRELDARVWVLPRGKVVKKPVVTKLWVNDRATEDREEWCEEVRLHCEECCDDKSETSEKQVERIRCRGDSAVAH